MSPLRQFADIRVSVLHQKMIKLNVDEFLCFHSFNESINQVFFCLATYTACRADCSVCLRAYLTALLHPFTNKHAEVSITVVLVLHRYHTLDIQQMRKRYCCSIALMQNSLSPK